MQEILKKQQAPLHSRAAKTTSKSSRFVPGKSQLQGASFPFASADCLVEWCCVGAVFSWRIDTRPVSELLDFINGVAPPPKSKPAKKKKAKTPTAV